MPIKTIQKALLNFVTNYKSFRFDQAFFIAKGQHLLGECYASGWGVDADKAEAIQWLRKAADQGIQLAAELLQEMEKQSRRIVSR